MSTITFVFLGLLTAHTGLLWWLSWRQSQHVLRHRGAVPQSFARVITLVHHQKASE
ncbi:MAG: hypothetical protein ACK48C_10360 [Roseiflexaceae bacterium]